MADPQGVSVAFTDAALVPSPTWTRLDTTYHVTGWTIDRGRTTELERTGTGTATVSIIDTSGAFDPTNATGPFYGNLDPMKQAAIALQNPVSLAWSTLFRGFVSEWEYDLDITERYGIVTLHLVDAFDFFTAAEMPTGSVTDGWAFGIEQPFALGDVYYPGGPVTEVQVITRIIQLLDDIGWPGTGNSIDPVNLRNIFTGNVAVQETTYARHDQALSVLLDAAEAEFPGVANLFMSKTGAVTFHGRFARFQPANYATYGIKIRKAGDLAAALANGSTAPISGLSFSRGQDKIINSATALPAKIADADVPAQTITDPASIDKYGRRSISFENLLTYHGDESPPNNANDETFLFAEYYVDNFASPRTRVNQIRFRPRDLSSLNAAALWTTICEVEISDRIDLTTTHGGGGGFNEGFFVEGIHYTASPMTTAYPEVTLELDVTPVAYYDTDPFPPTVHTFATITTSLAAQPRRSLVPGMMSG